MCCGQVKGLLWGSASPSINGLVSFSSPFLCPPSLFPFFSLPFPPLFLPTYFVSIYLLSEVYGIGALFLTVTASQDSLCNIDNNINKQVNQQRQLLCCLNVIWEKLWPCMAKRLQFSSVTQLCLTICDPMDGSTPGFPILHHLPELAQTYDYWVGDAIQPSDPLSPPSPPAFDFSQHQGLFQWVSSSNHVAKVLELQLQYQSFQWMLRPDFL